MTGDAHRWRPRLERLGQVLAWFAVGWMVGIGVWVFGPAIVLGWSPTVVTSGSMEPSIRAGDVVLVDRMGDAASVGAVVQFHDDSGRLTLHRVAAVDADGSIWLKGDSNGRLDPSPVLSRHVAGRGRFLVPYAAHPISVAMMLAVVGLGAARFALRGEIGRRVGGLGRVAVVVALLVSTPMTARAAFTTSTHNGGSTIEVLQVIAPSAPSASCGLIGAGSGTVNLTWSPSPTPATTAYEIVHRVGAGPLEHLAFVAPSQTSFSHTFNPGLLGVGAYRYAIRAVVGTFQSPTTPEVSVTITQVLTVYLCG